MARDPAVVALREKARLVSSANAKAPLEVGDRVVCRLKSAQSDAWDQYAGRRGTVIAGDSTERALVSLDRARDIDVWFWTEEIRRLRQASRC